MPNDEVLYNEIKQNKDYLYVCRACIETPIDLSNTNLYEHLPFSSEKHVDDGFYLTSQTASIENDNNFTENTSEFKVFEKGGLHFLHINANSILSKIEEVRLIAHKTNIAVIGITESKLESTVSDSEISITGYNIVRSDRNRHGEVLCAT